MANTKPSYDADYGEYVPGEDDIAVTYTSPEAAEEAILRRVLAERGTAGRSGAPASGSAA